MLTRLALVSLFTLAGLASGAGASPPPDGPQPSVPMIVVGTPGHGVKPASFQRPAGLGTAPKRPVDWARLHRPLRLPLLTPGATCPITGSRTPGWPQMKMNGRGPAFLLGVGGALSGVIDISQSYVDAQGWRGQKTPWAVRWRYQGPILIRGQRTDAAGSIRFAPGSGQHYQELRWPPHRSVGPKGAYRFWALETLFQTPGCYGFQADGSSFSTVVSMRVSG